MGFTASSITGKKAEDTAIHEDFKALQQGQDLRQANVSGFVDQVKAIEMKGELQQILAKTTDAGKRAEITKVIGELTTKFNLQEDATKAFNPSQKLEVEPVSLLAKYRAQARDIAAGIEAMIPLTTDQPHRESLGMLAGKIRLQYGIPADEVGPGTLRLDSPARRDQMALTERRRQEIREHATQLDDWAVRTDDPVLRQVLTEVAMRMWAQVGEVPIRVQQAS